MEKIYRSAEERRMAIQANADRMGIDDDYISLLVDTFYTNIRHDDTLGPIFKEAIGEKWDHHLSRMKDFWASVAMNAGRYSGKPVPAHQKLSQVQKEHFTVWLSLFRRTLVETAPNPEIVDYFMEKAERIAESLKLAMFGIPKLASGNIVVPVRSKSISPHKP